MIVERTNSQIVPILGMDQLEYLEITSKSQATQEDADQLADDLNENWWKKNRKGY